MPVKISSHRVVLDGIPLNEAAEVNVASGATTNIGAASSNNVNITGTSTITAFDTVNAGVTRKGRFAGSLTLTHNGTSLILPGNANITTAINDRFEAFSLGSGNWIVTKYQKADGTAVVAGGVSNAVTATTATTLTSTPTLLAITPASYGVAVTLPDATTCSLGGPIHVIDNKGAYPVKVLNSAGTLLGFVFAGVVSHISLSDKSTAAGVWTIENNELVGASAQLLTTDMTVINVCIALDSDREFILGSTASATYGVVYQKSTNTFGSVTLIRTYTLGNLNPLCLLQTTNQVLVVTCNNVNPGALEAVICTITSNTTINPQTPATATLSSYVSGNADGCGLIAVGTSFIFSYGVGTTAWQIREITVSGTTPTISAATVLGGTAGGLVVAGDSTHVIAVSTATTHLYTKPYTIGGLAAGTGTDTAVGSGSYIRKLFPIGTYFCVIYTDGSTSAGTCGIITLTGTTTTVTTAISNATEIADAIVVGSNKVLCLSSATTNNCNIITNTTGTASAGTAISTSSQSYRVCIYVSGTDVYIQEGTTSYVVNKIDCSGASPVKSKIIAQSGISNTEMPAFDIANAMLVRSPQAVYGTDYARTIIRSSTVNFASVILKGVFSKATPASLEYTTANYYRGKSDSERWCTDGATVITKIECVP